MSELLWIISIFGWAVYLIATFRDPNREPEPDEVVEADSPQDAIWRCSRQYGDEYGDGYEICSVRISQDECNPRRWKVWYEAMRKDGGPLTAIRLCDVGQESEIKI